MGELDPDMFDDLKETATKGGRRERVKVKRRKRVPTESDKERRAAEIRAAREARLKEAGKKIQGKLLERRFSTETPEKEDQLQRYISWVENSLAQGYPFVKEEDI